MKVLIAGHWSGQSPDLGVRDALLAIARGFQGRRPDWSAEVVPFGPGWVAAEALTVAPSLAPIVIEASERSTRRAGEALLRALDEGRVPVLEGGHNEHSDCGLGLLEAVSGVRLSRDGSLAERAAEALRIARERIGGREVVATASTARPLLGMSSVLAIRPDLSAQTVQDRGLTGALARFFEDAWADRPRLRLADGAQVRSAAALPGSGAGGGAAAMVVALGGRLVSTADMLAEATGLADRMAGADLVVGVEPLLHSPQLADAMLDRITGAAAAQALPVVAVCAETSLSAHEAAEWGIHGISVVRAPSAPELARTGARIAQTWAP